MILATTDRALKLAELWDDDAKAHRRTDPDTPVAAALERCAREMREMVAATHPDVVSLRAIHLRTGWSMAALRKWAKEKWEPQGEARRKGRSWEVDYDTAMAVPVKADRDLSELVGDGTAEDLSTLAEVLGRET